MQGGTEREYCQRCLDYTNHDIIGRDHRTEIDEVVKAPQHFIHEMLRCRGCETVIMRVTRHLEWENFEPDTFYFCEGIYSKEYLPPLPPHRHRRQPEWWSSNEIPLALTSLMNEIYSAYRCNLFRLAAMAIRAALENIMKEKIGDRPFKSLIDEFQKAGYLSTRQSLNLDIIIEAGHATIHRGWVPTKEDVDTLLDITESLIETVYLHEDRARTLDQPVPRRERPVGKDQSSGKKSRDV